MRHVRGDVAYSDYMTSIQTPFDLLENVRE